ncbi:MAG: hypothetical protein AB8G15_04665 [Saprospiraceae bacterium]
MKTHTINHSYRGKLLTLMVENIKPWYRLLVKKTRTPWIINQTQLQQFPKHSLGKDLALFLQKEQLELMPFFEEHDIMHILLGYRNTVLEEAQMQFFLLGNGKRTVFTLGACFLSVLLLPEYTKQFLQDYKKGKEALSLAKWDFRYLLCEPTQVLKNLLHRAPSPQRPFIF